MRHASRDPWRAAQAIETLFHEPLEEHYSELAHHYRRSGNTEKAVEYLQHAGRQAMQRSAYAVGAPRGLTRPTCRRPSTTR
jgi:hypothetical protein